MITQLISEQSHVIRVEVPQNTRTLSPALKELQALIISGRIHHDGNPVLSWCISNVIAREDANENVFPRKAKNELKIEVIFSPTLQAMCNQALAEARSALSLSDDWTPDLTKITADTIRSIEHRSSKWSPDHNAAAIDETQRIYKALKLNIYRDGVSSLALQDAA